MTTQKFLVLLTLPLWVACAPAKLPTGSRNVELTTADFGPEYRKNSCAYKFSDGVSVAPQVMPAPKLGSPFFGKTIDQSRLQIVGPLSGQGTLEFLQRDGLQPYSVPLSVGACTMLATLPLAPQGLLQIWNAANLANASSLIGLFLPADRVRGQGIAQPVILLRADTDRYSMVHEYMHFLYNRVRESQGKSSTAVSLRYRRQLTGIKPLLPMSDRDLTNPHLVQQVASLWIPFAGSVMDLVLNYPFEEMAVEANLTEALEKGQLARVTDFDRKNSANYINQNYQSGLEKLNSLLGDGEELRKATLRLGLTEQSEQIESLLVRVTELLDEARVIWNKYAIVPANFGVYQAPMTYLESEDKLAVPCTHAGDLRDGLGALEVPRLRTK